ncbi:exonuclease domain-containing protein [Actinosynnema sp. NPDC020468]|uniref:3'-5' exonuclease n=1 Tax=Actinosynnema sp. NPDC020468 TaxID=3154488 RepID=UPI0034059219
MYQDQAPAHLMTVAQLRSSGLRPGDPGVAGGWLEREFEGDVWRTVLYDARSATPLPAAVPPKARTDAAGWARDVLRGDAVVLDTELTDFAGRVIEISVLATDGTVLLDSLVDPEGAPIRPQAQRVHGISAAMLTGAPTMAHLWPRLADVLRDRPVIAWNAPFDQSRLRAEHERIAGDAPQPAWLARPWDCAMRRHAAWVGEPNSRGTGYRHHRLEGGHRAKGDCQALLERLHDMASTLTTPPPAGDLDTVKAAWPRVLEEVRRHNRSTEAMLTNALLLSAADHTLHLRHPSAPLHRRLAEPRCTTTLAKALTTVLNHPWTAEVAPHEPPA